MNKSLELSMDQRREFKRALVSAFPTQAKLRQMIDFGLGENLDVIAGGDNLDDTAFNLIVWARAKGKTSELIRAAWQENEGNSYLRRFVEVIGLATPAGEVESIVLKGIALADTEKWRADMAQNERAVCRIDFSAGIGVGTGFLVGPRAVLTNYHVIEMVRNGIYNSDNVRVQFDYKILVNGTELSGKSFKLARGDKWLADWSPISELDYALLELEDEAGNQSLGYGRNSPQRGWIRPTHREVEVGESLVILQHPQAGPIKFAVGAVKAIQSQENQLTYTTSTLPGSSGSPCFASDWRLVALHRSGDVHDGNRGVLISAILEKMLQGKGKCLLGN